MFLLLAVENRLETTILMPFEPFIITPIGYVPHLLSIGFSGLILQGNFPTCMDLGVLRLRVVRMERGVEYKLSGDRKEGRGDQAK